MLVILLIMLLVLTVYKKIMVQIGRNSVLSEENLIEIATDYIAHHKPIWIQRYELKIDTDFSILLKLVRIEIATNRLCTIRQLEDYLTGKFEQEIKIVFEDKA
jgi:hypothetical protein